MRDGFVARHEWLGALQGISEAEGGRLFKALLTYSADGEKIKLNGREQLLFAVFAAEIDREKEKARAKSEKARESVRKRWARDNDALAGESTNECERIRTNTNEYERIRTNGEGIAREDIYIHSSEDKGLIYSGDMSLNPGGNPGNPEDDDDINSEYGGARARIVRAWRDAFGKMPYPAVVDELLARYGAMDGGRGAEYVAGAIREAATRSAGDPLAYIHALMTDWYGEYERFGAGGGRSG